jgi:hypothetical protein
MGRDAAGNESDQLEQSGAPAMGAIATDAKGSQEGS